MTIATCFALALLLSPDPSSAQFAGFNSRGDYGLQSASQPDPGLYLTAPMYVRYHAGVYKDNNGDPVLPDERDSLDANAYVLGLVWVTESKILGGNYSFQIFPAWTDNNLEIPLFDVDTQVRTGFADLYLQPINLGWHAERAEYTAGLRLYAPTGTYDFLTALLNARYLWESGARTSLEGNTFVVTVTISDPQYSAELDRPERGVGGVGSDSGARGRCFVFPVR